ncbi:MAG TPA: GNAT family N-acetyltransferase [Usitatibacter sp.]|nr:GNAT family N-acetyltransferase [Usitatibacter sp.]
MIRLDPMTAAEFTRYLEAAIPAYAQAHVQAGDCVPEEAVERAKDDYDNLLPLGLLTPDNHLCSIRADAISEPVGMIWFSLKQSRWGKSAYIYDFLVYEAARGKGYGSQTLRALEALLAAQGVTRLSLNVMAWNHRAKALYERMGFGVAGIGMTKVVRQ